MNDTADATIWMIVEVFGHRSHAGRCTEEEKVGVKMLRIDEPTMPFGGNDPSELKWTTHYYAGASIFSMVPTTEEVVMRRAGVRRPVALTHDAGPITIEQETCEACDRPAGTDCGAFACPGAHHEQGSVQFVPQNAPAQCIACNYPAGHDCGDPLCPGRPIIEPDSRGG